MYTRGAAKALNMAKLDRIVSVIGLIGDGKSAIAKYIVGKLLTEEYELICITSAEEWESYVDLDRKQIVLIDNIFGCVTFRASKCDKWLSLHDNMMAAIDSGLHYIVVTSNKDFFKHAYDRKYAQVFQHTVDLTSPDCALTPIEKNDIGCYLTIEFGDKNTKWNRKSCQLLKLTTVGFPGMCVEFIANGLTHTNKLDVPMQNLNKLNIINVTKWAHFFKIGPFI